MTSPRTQLNDYLARRKHVSDMPPAVRALYYRDMAHEKRQFIAENRRDMDALYAVEDAMAEYAKAQAYRREYVTTHRDDLALERAISASLRMAYLREMAATE